MNAALTIVAGFEIEVMLAAGRNSFIAHCFASFFATGGFALMIAAADGGRGADVRRVFGSEKILRAAALIVAGVGFVVVSRVTLCLCASAKHSGCQFVIAQLLLSC